MTISLPALRKLCADATPGPWSYDDGTYYDPEHGLQRRARATIQAQSEIILEADDSHYSLDPNWLFIAQSRTALPELVEWVGRALRHIFFCEPCRCLREVSPETGNSTTVELCARCELLAEVSE